jgi:poly(3-hydroxybutyrate) depolymerase
MRLQTSITTTRLPLAILAAAIWPALAGGWPPEVQTATFKSPADGSEQRTLLWLPPGDDPVPLLVAFHTWSGDYLQDESPYADWCIRRGWAFAHPNLRGPAIRPEAAGSAQAVADLRGLLELLRSKRSIDPQRIYCIGVSGGGMMTLLAAAHMPEVWAAASAWVPVTDLAAWHADSVARRNKYAGDMERVCGGPPGGSAEVDANYASRSAVGLLAKAFATNPVPFPLDINSGIHDGHTGSVPVSHGLRAFNVLAPAADRVPEETIAAMVETRAVPAGLRFAGSDPLYRTRPVLLRKTAGNTRITVFDGGHEILHEAGLTWLEAQARGRPAVWEPTPHEPPILGRKAAASGR